jgi:DNA-binding response OmpR family regulator
MRKLLIVDDERLTGELLVTYLTIKGFSVEVAENGRDGFMKAQAINPDLIILDMMMPDMNGEELCRMLRQATLTSDIPIIFLSALHSYDAQRRAREAGANHYLPKNTPLKELTEQVKRLITEREDQLNLRKPSPDSPPKP